MISFDDFSGFLALSPNYCINYFLFVYKNAKKSYRKIILLYNLVGGKELNCRLVFLLILFSIPSNLKFIKGIALFCLINFVSFSCDGFCFRRKMKNQINNCKDLKKSPTIFMRSVFVVCLNRESMPM